MNIHCKNDEKLRQTKFIYNNEKHRKFEELCEFSPSKLRFKTTHENSLQKMTKNSKKKVHLK